MAGTNRVLYRRAPRQFLAHTARICKPTKSVVRLLGRTHPQAPRPPALLLLPSALGPTDLPVTPPPAPLQTPAGHLRCACSAVACAGRKNGCAAVRGRPRKQHANLCVFCPGLGDPLCPAAAGGPLAGGSLYAGGAAQMGGELGSRGCEANCPAAALGRCASTPGMAGSKALLLLSGLHSLGLT